MIFVTVGSQKFQFNRMLEEIDQLVGDKKIKEEVYAQTGYSDYQPKNYKFNDFLDRDEFQKLMNKSNIVITHGGTGAIISAVKQKKKVIAIPRLAKYGEHVDDHQLQIVSEFEKSNLISAVYEVTELKQELKEISNKKFNSYESNTQKILDFIEEYIDEKKERIMVIGSSLNDKGGIVTVMKGIEESKLKETYNFVHIDTYNTVSSIKKILIFIRGYFRVVNESKKVNVAHIHMSYKGSFYRKSFIIKYLKKCNKKIILHMHGSTFKAWYASLNDKQKKYVNKTLNSVDTMIVLSDSWKEYFSTIVDKKKIEIISNSIKVSTIEKKYPSKNKKVQFLFLGRFGKRKGIYDLLEVTKKLNENYKGQFNLVIGGDGEIENVNRLINEYKLENIVSNKGWISGVDKEKLLMNSNVFILPSYNEGLPMAILEAMSYKIPCISTNVGGIPEVIENDKNGFIFEPGDKDSLYDCMEAYIIDKGKIEKQGTNAYEKVRKAFNTEIEMEKFKQIY